MKIVLVYRTPNISEHSIEELFQAIAAEMRKEAEVIEYNLGSRYKILLDAWKLRKLKADIYHITGAVNYMVCSLPLKKTVLTIHDLVHYQYTLKGFKRYIYKWLWLILPICLSRLVTAVSLATAKEIHSYLGIDKKNIHIIPNCYNSLFQPVAKEFAAACPTVLQIGTLPHKNVLNLIKALEGIHCRLILIGYLDDITINQLKSCDINYENFAGITLQQIYQHYIASDIVTFISLREGFGVPIIEAQAVGRAVITSDYAPMSIVAGNGACLVNPLSVTAIRDGLIKIINDTKYRNNLINNGFENIKNYSITKITAQYLNLYRTISK